MGGVSGEAVAAGTGYQPEEMPLAHVKEWEASKMEAPCKQPPHHSGAGARVWAPPSAEAPPACLGEMQDTLSSTLHILLWSSLHIWGSIYHLPLFGVAETQTIWRVLWQALSYAGNLLLFVLK